MSNNSANKNRVAIIGAGPIGLEAALYAVLAGYDPHVYDCGSVAANVQQWGHVTLFSPFGMNASSWGRETLTTGPSAQPLPADDALLTGRQFVEHYLQPLSRLPQLAGRIHEHTCVESIGRSHYHKGDHIGQPGRAEDPFQLLLSDKSGERMAEADIVLDCSGTYGNHNWIGSGGIACIGERLALVDSNYLLPDITGSDRAHFAGKTTLVAGSGYSAATAIVALASLVSSEPQTRAIWVTRSTRTPPLTPVADDPLPERARLTTDANRLAVVEDGPVEWLPGRSFRSIMRNSREPDARYTVCLESNDPSTNQKVETELTVDRVIVNVGYRPDRTLYEELQIHECYASSGPMKLAAALLGETSADCTAQTSHGPEALRNPEPNLFILGAKSYGRDNRFLIQIGHQQITDVFSMIAD